MVVTAVANGERGERKRVRDKKNESEKEIESNGEMETREERERELCCRRRERYVLGGERKVNKIIKRNYSIDVRTVSYLRWYCSGVPNFLHLAHLMKVYFWYLVCQMPNIWNLAHLIRMLLYSSIERVDWVWKPMNKAINTSN